MPRHSPVISSLTGGEWSPQMYGQIELAGYASACRLMRNFVCRVHGGAQKRPGTIFVAEVKNSKKPIRLMAFQYATAQAYCIEVGSGYMRFYKDRGRIEREGGILCEIGTPFPDEHIQAIRYAQDKDLLYLFHQMHPPQKLIRYDHDDWDISNAEFTNGPYLPARPSTEHGTNMIVNGDMELDANWTTADPGSGHPIFQIRSNKNIYEGLYARWILAHSPGYGIRSDPFETTTGKLYRLRFRILTWAGTFRLRIRQGGAADVYLLDETITGVPQNVWSEYERTFKDPDGGAAAFVEFLTALTANITGYVSNYPHAHTPQYVKATSYYTASNAPHLATDPNRFITGASSGNCWQSASYAVTNQRFHIDLMEEKVITRIYYENFHNSGSNTDRGAKDFTLWGSNSSTAFEDLVYSHDDDWTEISLTDNQFGRHATKNKPDPQYIEVLSTKPYRYYAFKLQNNYGNNDHMGLRRIELQEAEYENDPNLYIDKVELHRTEGITMAPSDTTGLGITITASEEFFEEGHVGSFLSITHTVGDKEETGYAKITDITSTTVAVADVIIDFGDTAAVFTWREGAWSPKNGYPACGTFYEQRLICASSIHDPDAIWGSKTTEYENFTPGTKDADPVSYKLQSDIIRWVSPMGQLVVGTVNAEYRLGAQGGNEPLTPTNIKITPQSRKGSADIEPVNCGNTILFVQGRGRAGNRGKKLRELSYNYVNDSYDGIDLSLFAEHISGAGFTRIAFMSSPFPILWACTDDGRLIGMTYEREQKVVGWHCHPMENGAVEDICVVPGENQDDLYLVVRRTVNGETKRYIEVMADFDWGAEADGYFVDCGLSGTFDTPVDVVSGLDHLEGAVVTVCADGAVQSPKTVVDGQITLDAPASVVHVGLPFTSELEPLDLQGGALEGTSQGKIKRIHGIALYLYQSAGGEIGQTSENTARIFFYTEKELNGEAMSLYTGIKDESIFPGDWLLEGRVYIRHDDPLPFTILSIMPRYRVEDR